MDPTTSLCETEVPNLSKMKAVSWENPRLHTFGVFLSEFVEYIGGVETCVLTQLSRDDLQGLGHRADEQLLLTLHRPVQKINNLDRMV